MTEIPQRHYRYEITCSTCGKVRRTNKKASGPKRCAECHNKDQRKHMAAMMQRRHLPADGPRKNR